MANGVAVMENINENAFPIALDDRPGAYPAKPGMMLVDYFAARAMLRVRPVGSIRYADFAKEAYNLAEAMMAERKKRNYRGGE
jgi:hypothetical protein